MLSLHKNIVILSLALNFVISNQSIFPNINQFCSDESSAVSANLYEKSNLHRNTILSANIQFNKSSNEDLAQFDFIQWCLHNKIQLPVCLAKADVPNLCKERSFLILKFTKSLSLLCDRHIQYPLLPQASRFVSCVYILSQYYNIKYLML